MLTSRIFNDSLEWEGTMFKNIRMSVATVILGCLIGAGGAAALTFDPVDCNVPNPCWYASDCKGWCEPQNCFTVACNSHDEGQYCGICNPNPD